MSDDTPTPDKITGTWLRVVRSPIPKRGQAFIMNGDMFEDGLFRVVVGYDVPPEIVAELTTEIENRERVEQLVERVNRLLTMPMDEWAPL